MTGATFSRTRMTLEEFKALPESQEHIELIQGEIIMSPAPKFFHQKLVFEIAKTIDNLTQAGQTVISPMDVYFASGDVTQPDVFWVGADNEHCQVGEDDYWHGAPDLVVEILSPSTAAQDRGKKFDMYEANGVQEYWLVDPPGKYFEVYYLVEHRFVRQGVFGIQDTFASSVLDKQVIEISKIFDG